jgi:hypothetical protein
MWKPDASDADAVTAHGFTLTLGGSPVISWWYYCDVAIP